MIIRRRLGLLLLPLLVALIVACASADLTELSEQPEATTSQQSVSGCDGLSLGEGLAFIEGMNAEFAANPHRASLKYTEEMKDEMRVCLEGEIVGFPRSSRWGYSEADRGPRFIYIEVQVEEGRGFGIGHRWPEFEPFEWTEPPHDPTEEEEKAFRATHEAESARQQEISAEQALTEEQSVVDWENFVMNSSVGDKIRAECKLFARSVREEPEPIYGPRWPKGTLVHGDCKRIEE